MGIPEKDDDKKANGHMSLIWRRGSEKEMKKWMTSDIGSEVKAIR